jgi:thymidylate synthase (FAD)
MNYQKEIKVLDYGYVRYIDHMGSDARILEAARVSYKSKGKGDEADKKLLKYLWKHKHTSPFEMCKITLNIKMPIFIMRQYVRHRMQNLNEVSARYTELPNEFYIPEVWRKQDTKNKQGSVVDDNWTPSCEWAGEIGRGQKDCSSVFALACADAYICYQSMLASGISREMARLFLPVNIYTEIYTCWDLKNLLHFVALRDDGHAQWEIQQYGKAIKEILTDLFPWTMEAYEENK